MKPILFLVLVGCVFLLISRSSDASGPVGTLLLAPTTSYQEEDKCELDPNEMCMNSGSIYCYVTPCEGTCDPGFCEDSVGGNRCVQGNQGCDEYAPKTETCGKETVGACVWWFAACNCVSTGPGEGDDCDDVVTRCDLQE